MVKKDIPETTLFYISLGLIGFSFVVFVTSIVLLIVTMKRRKAASYCSQCKRLLQLENVIIKRGIGAVSKESLMHIKTAMSATLTENPEYDAIPAHIPDYNKELVLSAELGKCSGIPLTHSASDHHMTITSRNNRNNFQTRLTRSATISDNFGVSGRVKNVSNKLDNFQLLREENPCRRDEGVDEKDEYATMHSSNSSVFDTYTPRLCVHPTISKDSVVKLQSSKNLKLFKNVETSYYDVNKLSQVVKFQQKRGQKPVPFKTQPLKSNELEYEYMRSPGLTKKNKACNNPNYINLMSTSTLSV